jgi:hypothetical protein
MRWLLVSEQDFFAYLPRLTGCSPGKPDSKPEQTKPQSQPSSSLTTRFLKRRFRLSCGSSFWYNSYTTMRFDFDAQKIKRLRANPKRGIGFEEAQEIFKHPYYLDQRSDPRAVQSHWLGRRKAIRAHF